MKLSEEVASAERILHRETVAGRRYLLVRREADLQIWNVAKETPERRLAPRTLKQAVLGRDRFF